MEENKKESVSKSENFKNALCYLPFGFAVMFFIEQKRSEELMKHIKYGGVVFIAYLVMSIFSWLFFLVYVWVAWFLWWKAYNWERVDIDFIDDLEKKIKEKK